MPPLITNILSLQLAQAGLASNPKYRNAISMIISNCRQNGFFALLFFSIMFIIPLCFKNKNEQNDGSLTDRTGSSFFCIHSTILEAVLQHKNSTYNSEGCRIAALTVSRFKVLYDFTFCDFIVVIPLDVNFIIAIVKGFISFLPTVYPLTMILYIG